MRKAFAKLLRPLMGDEDFVFRRKVAINELLNARHVSDEDTLEYFKRMVDKIHLIDPPKPLSLDEIDSSDVFCREFVKVLISQKKITNRKLPIKRKPTSKKIANQNYKQLTIGIIGKVMKPIKRQKPTKRNLQKKTGSKAMKPIKRQKPTKRNLQKKTGSKAMKPIKRQKPTKRNLQKKTGSKAMKPIKRQKPTKRNLQKKTGSKAMKPIKRQKSSKWNLQKKTGNKTHRQLTIGKVMKPTKRKLQKKTTNKIRKKPTIGKVTKLTKRKRQKVFGKIKEKKFLLMILVFPKKLTVVFLVPADSAFSWTVHKDAGRETIVHTDMTAIRARVCPFQQKDEIGLDIEGPIETK